MTSPPTNCNHCWLKPSGRRMSSYYRLVTTRLSSHAAKDQAGIAAAKTK